MRIAFLSTILLFSMGSIQAQKHCGVRVGIVESVAPPSQANPSLGLPKSTVDGRFGFLALFEVRFGPGVIKTLDVRQFYSSEQQAVEGFMRVKASMPVNAVLVEVTWVSPTEGHSGVGN